MSNKLTAVVSALISSILLAGCSRSDNAELAKAKPEAAAARAEAATAKAELAKAKTELTKRQEATPQRPIFPDEKKSPDEQR